MNKFQISNSKFQIGKKGSAWVGIFLILIFLTTIGLSLSQNIVVSMKTAKRQEQLVSAQALAEAGIEKAIWKLNKGDTYTGEDPNSPLTLSTGQVDVIVDSDPLNSTVKYVTATGYVPKKAGFQRKRTVKVKLQADFNGAGLGFLYGVQVGSLGVYMSPNSKIIGSVLSGGAITGDNNTQITGDAVITKNAASNTITKVTIGESLAKPGNATAKNLIDTHIWGKAFYDNKDNKTVIENVAGNGPYNNPDDVSLPVSDATIGTWQGWAIAGDNLGPTTINGSVTFNKPTYIDGDLNITTGSILTLKGLIYVRGDINIASGATVKLDPIFGNDSSMIIAGDSNDATKGKITVNSNVKICGSYSLSDCLNNIVPAGNKSYIMMLSTREAPNYTDPAIFAGNNSKAVVYYTTRGFLEVNNNGNLRAMTGGGLHLSNGAIVEYDFGLINANFSAGPGGSWTVREWQVVY